MFHEDMKQTDKRIAKSIRISVILLCAVIAEIACSNTDRYSMSQTKTSYASDYSDFRALKAELDERESDEFYRMELTYNRARMDPAWYGYNGVSTFTSMAYEKMANMQSNLGVYGNFINSYTYYLQTPVYNMMNSLRYIVDNDDNVEVEDDYYTNVGESGKFTAYKNEYWLPIAFAVNSGIKDWYSAYTNPFLTQGEWFNLATGVDDVFGRMTVSDVRYFNINEIDTGFETGDIYFSKTASGDADMTIVLTVEQRRHCYLFVDSNDFEDISIFWEDDRSVVQNTDEPYIYDLGIINPGETVEVLITPKDDSFNCNMNFYPYYIDDSALEEGYKVLQQGQMNVETFDDTYIKGTVNAGEDCVMFTSIPYDKGWTVKVDGKALTGGKVFALEDAYLCFDLPAGEHTVEFSFRQSGLLLGAAISLATLLLLLAAAVIFRVTRPLREKKYEEKCRLAQDKYETEKQQREEEDARQRLMAQIPDELSPVDMELFESMVEEGYPAENAEETAGEESGETDGEESPEESADTPDGEAETADETALDEEPGAGDESGEEEAGSDPDDTPEEESENEPEDTSEGETGGETAAESVENVPEEDEN